MRTPYTTSEKNSNSGDPLRVFRYVDEINQNQPSAQPKRGRHISDLGMLDLRYAKTAEDLADIESITDVGVILISEALGGLQGINVSDVGGIIPIPEGGKTSVLTGQTKMTGEALAAGDPECSLIVAGQLFITTPVTSVGFREIQVHGQLLAVRGSENAISAKLTRLNGQSMYIPEKTRMVLGESSYGREFFELLGQPEALLVIGSLTLESDVTREMLKEKIPEIILIGKIKAPSHLLPQLEVLTREKIGQITGHD